MTDLHLQILRLVARQRQDRLDEHDAAEQAGDGASVSHRRDLEQASGRADASVAAAEARRRHRRPGRAR